MHNSVLVNSENYFTDSFISAPTSQFLIIMQYTLLGCLTISRDPMNLPIDFIQYIDHLYHFYRTYISFTFRPILTDHSYQRYRPSVTLSTLFYLGYSDAIYVILYRL